MSVPQLQAELTQNVTVPVPGAECDLSFSSQNELPVAKVNLERRQLMPYAAAFNLVTAALGSSIVATPYAFKKTTPLGGLVVEVGAAFITCLATICLFEASKKSNAASYIDLSNKAFGTSARGRVWTALLTVIPLCSMLIGILAVYIVIASGILVGYAPFIHEIWWRVLICAIMFLVGLTRTFRTMKHVSTICVAADLIIVTCLLLALVDFVPSEPVKVPKVSISALSGIPIIFIGLNGIMGVPGMTGEMPKSQYKYTTLVSVVPLLIIAVFNCLLGYLGSTTFGEATEEDIIRQLFNESNSKLTGISAKLLVAQLALSVLIPMKAPLVIFPLKELLLDRSETRIEDRTWGMNALATLAIVVICGCIAIVFPDLAAILNMFGGFGSIMITGIGAGTMSLMIEERTWARVRASVVVAFGVILIAINFYVVIESFYESKPPS